MFKKIKEKIKESLVKDKEEKIKIQKQDRLIMENAKVQDYLVLEDSSQSGLEKRVMRFVYKGYEPIGGVNTIATSYDDKRRIEKIKYLQAVVKYKDKG